MRDGIYNPESEQEVPPDPAVIAFDRWFEAPNDPDLYDLLLEALRPAAEAEDPDLRRAYDELANASLEGREKARTNLRELLAAQKPLNMATWSDVGTPDPRKWILSNWLPVGAVSSLYGWGGLGKSMLALQLSAAVAADRDGLADVDSWLGVKTAGPTKGSAVPRKGRPVMFASYEDDHHELARRLAGVSGKAAPWVTPGRLKNLHLVDLAGRGPLWGVEKGKHTSTAGDLQEAGKRLREEASRLEAVLVVLDPLAAVYRGSEIDRSLVRDFLSNWDAWARSQKCAVLLLAHQSRTRDATSGSTDWEAGARSVWTLGKEPLCIPPHKGASHSLEKCGSALKLTLAKANYADLDAPNTAPLEVEKDFTGGGFRLAIKGRWGETTSASNTKPGGGDYDPAA